MLILSFNLIHFPQPQLRAKAMALSQNSQGEWQATAETEGGDFNIRVMLTSLDTNKTRLPSSLVLPSLRDSVFPYFQSGNNDYFYILFSPVYLNSNAPTELFSELKGKLNGQFYRNGAVEYRQC